MSFVFLLSALLASQPNLDNDRSPLKKYEPGTKLASVANKYAKLSVRYHEACFFSKPTAVTITLENVGEKPIDYSTPDIYRQFEFEVFASDGKSIPLTRHGQALLKKDDALKAGFRSGHLWVLATGQKFEMTFDIQRAFDITVQDEYKVNVGIREGFWVHVRPTTLLPCPLEIKGIRVNVTPEKSE